MNSKKIIVVGTSANGGIKSVIQAYEKSGFYSQNNMLFIETCNNKIILKRLYIALIAFIRIFNYTVSDKVSLIHMHMSMRGSFFRKLIIFRIAKLKKIPTIIHLHGSEFKEFYDSSPDIVKKLIKYLFDSVSCIIVLSNSWKKYISSLTANQIYIINNFVPDIYNDETKQLNRRRVNMLYLGVFGERKGIYDLLTVFAEINEQVKGVKLICAGNGEIEQVNQKIKELNLSNKVINLGWISGEKKINVLNESAIFVLPSYNEGLPMAIIEAMSCSMAVVATNVGGIPEIVDKQTGVLINPGNIVQLKKALLDLLTMEESEFKKICRQSRDRYERVYSSKHNLSQMNEIYTRLGVTP